MDTTTWLALGGIGLVIGIMAYKLRRPSVNAQAPIPIHAQIPLNQILPGNANCLAACRAKRAASPDTGIVYAMDPCISVCAPSALVAC